MDENENDRSIVRLNGVLLLILTGLLVLGYLAGSSSAPPLKEVRHLLGGKPLVERCVSCHDPATHRPVIGHEPTTEACTSCHNGMGKGTTVAGAHQSTPSARSTPAGEGPAALFAGDTATAGCLRCHPPQQLPADTMAAKGWQLAVERGCLGCHRVGQVGGAKGPDLTRIGDHLGRTALASRIRAPQRSGLYSIMPDYRLGAREIDALTVFLQGQSMLHLRPVGYRAVLPASGIPSAPFNCSGCHKYRGKDGQVAPDLDLSYGQRSQTWLTNFLRDPQSLRPGARMPAITDERAVSALAGTLLKTPEDQARPTSAQERYDRYCARCHGTDGGGRGLIAANLAGAPRPFLANPGDFLLSGRERLVASVAAGIPGTSMPPFKGMMTRKETEELVDLVLVRYVGLRPAQRLPDIVVPLKTSIDAARAEATYGALCARCHGEAGDQGSRVVHPKYPQPRNFRNRPYMDYRTDEQLFRAIARGVPGTRMKAYGGPVAGSGVKAKAQLPEQEIWGLVEHVRRIGKNDE